MRLSRQLLQQSASVCLLLLAAGCASIVPKSPDGTPAVERHYQDAIDLSGRLSVLYQSNDREESLHGSFTWQQTGHHINVTLLSPLGQTLATIDIKPGIAVLTQSGKLPITATDVDILTEQTLGWPLPVSGLRDWLQGFGRQADGTPFVASPSGKTNRFTTLDGWNLSYDSWQDKAADTVQDRPRRIDLARDTAQAGPVSIRIVIDQWQGR